MAKKEGKEEQAKDDSDNKGKKKMIIIIAAAVILLLGIGIAVYLFFIKKPPPKEEPQNKQIEMMQTLTEEQTDIGPMIDIKEFIVNIISEEGTHYVKAALTLELTNEEVLEEATKRMPQIRDAVLLLIGNKTFEELQDLQGKKQIKAELKNKINAFLKSGRIRNVYLTDFVVQ